MHVSDRRRSGGNPDGSAEVSFARSDDGAGLVITDRIERRQYRLNTPEPVSIEAADPTRFWFPTDAAVSIETDRIELPSVVAVYVRDGSGEMLAEAEHFAYEEFPEGDYSLELCASIKTYLRVEGPLIVAADGTRTRIELDGTRSVLVGARSRHEQPAATVTTTAEPVDVMAAVSTFGSALKTTSVERSYPTLRGHPPLLELGDDLDVPEGIEPPKTGIRIELPETLQHVYVATPLAYYLGAEVVPGEVPRIVTDRGFEHALDSARGFENEVERVLKQVFLFDCVVRTEGYYEVDLRERRELESRLEFDVAAAYDWSIARQLEAYLDVPYATVEDLVPEWRLTTHMAPTRENVELLPFVTNDLAVVRTPQTNPLPRSEVQAVATDEFFRAESAESEFTRSAGTTAAGRSYVQPEATDSLEQAWMGDGTPIGASKATSKAYHNRLNRTPIEGEIGITVVCNDPRMADERDVVDEVYGSREELPFDVRVEYGLTVEELREVLRVDTDFLHYIGHIDAEGFECADGRLDATTLDSIGTDAFLLNACSSYEQGTGLIEAGAIAGIVTLSDVVNSAAVRVGGILARLLNRGFPLRSALEIAREEAIAGSQYTVVGDGGLAIAQSESGMPNICYVRPTEDDWFELEFRNFPTSERGIGSLVMPHLRGNTQHFLSSGTIDTFELPREELQRFLSLEEVPVIYRNSLHWSSEIVDEL